MGSRSHHTFTKKIKVFYIMSNQTDRSDLTDLKSLFSAINERRSTINEQQVCFLRSTKDDQRLTNFYFDH